ncbi:divalent cation tolerance protein CutA [Candidatus Pacearchaeota archaeon]|nr:divalent cation tolerance protein CutA [Candidatus Pacearchaeota archaeon]
MFKTGYIIIKTTFESKKDAGMILKNHKYKTPGITSVKINNGSKKYLNWLKENSK